MLFHVPLTIYTCIYYNQGLTHIHIAAFELPEATPKNVLRTITCQNSTTDVCNNAQLSSFCFPWNSFRSIKQSACTAITDPIHYIVSICLHSNYRPNTLYCVNGDVRKL